MASLHDVARLAGVSKSTVSRVINDEYGVKEATKQKVRQAVAECGYVPNQVAKDLKSQKTIWLVSLFLGFPLMPHPRCRWINRCP